MRLKRVKIFGFKTFADRTEFDLQGNLVAVVGPNGCGKSNLVDAILWGLGEGNARHLRAQSSQDVIFSGSARRKPLGFAEVNLLFDNEDGVLPVQSSEVSVTRRLNRAGDSEYFINRQSCRLRDVFDLLADTGLGRSGYSIVGQKEIDQALAASPEDRRSWVDEAAGVQRYRARKVESLKRLASAQDHINRISDILNEIEGQREPLREEAERAVRYKSILASLREVESGLLMVEVAKATAEVRELEGNVAAGMRLAKAELEAAEAAEAAARSASEQVRRIDAELERARDGRQLAMTSAERAEASIQIAEQKLSTLADLERNLGEEAEILKNRIADALAELTALEAELGQERARLQRVREECSGAGVEASQLREKLQVVEEELAHARELHNKKLRQEAETAHVVERIKALKREIEGVEKTLPDLVAGRDEAQASHDSFAAAVFEHERAIAELTKSLHCLESRESEEAQTVRKKLAERASLEGKKQGVESTIEAHEGLNQGARAVLVSAEKGAIHGEYIPVGEALEVKKELATAIETALGGSVNDLIVKTEAEAKSAIEYLKSNRLGRATFQPLPLMRSFEPSPELRRLTSRPGVVGRASDLIDCQSSYRPVFESLLGRVLVVQSLDVAIQLARTSGWSRLVTLEGEVVHSGGAVTGGTAAKSSYGLVQRKADLAEVISELKELDAYLAAADLRASEVRKEREGLNAGVVEKRAMHQEVLNDLKDAKDWLHNVQNELNATERSAHRLHVELDEHLSRTFEEFPVMDLSSIEEKRDVLVSALAARTADADSAEERMREAGVRAKQAETRLEIGRKRLLAAEENEKLRERRILNLGPERERAVAGIQGGKADLERAAASRKNSEAEIAALQAKRSELTGEMDRQSESARSARAHAQVGTENAHQAELIRARTETRRASVVQRLIEEYSISEEDALLQSLQVVLPSDAATVVGRLRREIKAMGEVNLGAVDAFERLTTRWDELNSQHEDVSGGIKQLEASVRELDKLTRDRFVDTFEKLKVAFSETFVRLFPGGEGRIYLTDEENVLETGVEIDVLLPGKKRQRLELLSGGERSLCATSFLFSLLKVKPSPLVILDEVDAPLDGRNVERFLALLNDFAQFAQFILITHNPTTIESAPVWLGVTMDEPGVSTLVPVRFTPLAVIEAGGVDVAPTFEVDRT
jgi:chromosome segregation protein